jgi:hypothetical protein
MCGTLSLGPASTELGATRGSAEAQPWLELKYEWLAE